MFVLVGCAKQIDRFTIDKVIERAIAVDDVEMVCELGQSLTHALGAVSRNEPHRALTVSEAVAGLCAQQRAWEADLVGHRAKHNLGLLGDARAAEITDANLKAAREHTLAAGRFERSWLQLIQQYGPIGVGDCPKIKEKDEISYLLGLVGGMLALLHDRAGGGVLDIPFDRPLQVARGSVCLDDARWWHTPAALRTGAWATVPGSAPEGVDPWEALDAAAEAGDDSGVRIARAMQVLLAANAGRNDDVEAGIRAFVAVDEARLDRGWVLLDSYASSVVLHQSDLLWTRASGHRTSEFGALPSDAPAPAPTGPDPFGGDDPFGMGVPTDVPPDEPEPVDEETAP